MHIPMISSRNRITSDVASRIGTAGVLVFLCLFSGGCMGTFMGKAPLQYWRDLRSLESSMTRSGIGKMLVELTAPELVPSPQHLTAGLRVPAQYPALMPALGESSRFALETFCLRVLTANLHLLPPPFAADHEARLDGFARIVRGRNPDLVLLQEVWLERYLTGLRRRLPEYAAFAPAPRIGNPTGLVILSRLPHSDACYRMFPARLDFNLEEKLARKGFLAVTCSAGPVPFRVVTAHLYAHRGDLEFGFTQAQFQVLKDFCGTMAEPVILGGDMNLEPGALFPLVGGVFAIEPDGGRTAVRGPPGRRIDYVMARSSLDWEISIRSEVVTEPVVSDHFPVFADVMFRQKMR